MSEIFLLIRGSLVRAQPQEQSPARLRGFFYTCLSVNQILYLAQMYLMFTFMTHERP